MKISALIAFIQVLADVKDTAKTFHQYSKPSKVDHVPYRVLDYRQCCYSVYVYRIACHHNLKLPHDKVHEQQLVDYLNWLFETCVPLSQYQKIWRNFKPK